MGIRCMTRTMRSSRKDRNTDKVRKKPATGDRGQEFRMAPPRKKKRTALLEIHKKIEKIE